MKNRKAQECCWCGKLLQSGEGNLVFVGEEDENLGFGPMGETGWLVSCIDKKTCDQRRKEQREERARRQREKEKADQLEMTMFSTDDGEYVIPNGKKISLQGIEFEREGKGFTIYGGGRRYVDTGEWLWRVDNNGGDGDNWGANNIRTGGAGGIGKRYRRTPERLAYLQTLVNLTQKWEKEEREKAEEEEAEEERIREGLLQMIGRGITLEMIEGKLKKGQTFCPRELTVKGRETVRLTVREAKRILQEEKYK